MPLIRGLVILVVSVLITLLLSANLMEYDETVVLRKGVDDDIDAQGEVELDYLLGSGAPPMPNSSSHLRETVPTQVLSYGDDHTNALKERLRPRKNPKGEIWHGWPKSSSSSPRSRALPRNIGSSHPWWRNSRQCFEVDQICHAVKENEWFYYPQTNHPVQDVPDYLFQPNMELKSAPAKYDGGRDRGESRISIKVSSSSILRPDDIDFEINNGQSFLVKSASHDNNNLRCQLSSTPMHIVLQSLFNDMIGEFYARTLVRLYHLMMKGAEEQTNQQSKSKKMPWDERIQFYSHISYGNKKMLDGHKLLLSGMLSDPDSPAAKSFVDLFVDEEGTGGSSSGSSADCQCYEKMVFCGYDVYTHDVNVLSEDFEPANIVRGSGNAVDDENGTNEQYTHDENAAMNLSFDNDLKYTLWSATLLDESVELGCSRGAGEEGDEYSCKEWNGLRNFLATNFHRHYRTLEEDVLEQRMETLLAKGVIKRGYVGNTTEFHVIGLTQRTYRRAWINLPDIIEKCDAAFVGRAICVEVNVENMSSPYEQLVMHRSLDVLIGVHGAQLTQAVLLPPQGHVLELLPWITDYIRGAWVQTTHHPTPLGVIFHNSDLNHLGYSLDRNSVPLCQDVVEEELQSCFMKQKKKFIWENRDFVIDSKIVLKYIQNFVMFGTERNRTCDEMETSLDKRFVLYNIWCIKSSQSKTYHIHQNSLSVLHSYHSPVVTHRAEVSPKLNAKRTRVRHTDNTDDITAFTGGNANP